MQDSSYWMSQNPSSPSSRITTPSRRTEVLTRVAEGRSTEGRSVGRPQPSATEVQRQKAWPREVRNAHLDPPTRPPTQCQQTGFNIVSLAFRELFSFA
ncbi:hypothetical protein CDAR_488521 [Caerostris darwini]|uniref:Uncharacterized protein n=1 Tax=Caerostris darwini TaxID=1538125 RepID=A0AAV4WJ69_9ARAC|nr:hypothetical protein CDAR_488521 [Caerostris darwini]